MNEFELLGPLPEGTTVLEASAGTGKTYTIAALVTRYVAEGVAALDDLLVVTFGRGAAQELRDRVRERLVGVRDALAPGAPPSTDPLVAHLAAVDRAATFRRLADAVASFDAATVATTHGFCEQVLRALGTAGDTDEAARLVENLDDLTVEVVQDLYVRKWGHPDAGTPEFDLEAAIELAKVAVGDGQAGLVPTDPPAGGSAEVRLRFAQAVRREVAVRKRARRVLGFDDLLTRLRDTLADPAQQAAAARLRARFRVVLVDEFQDTDPVQWDVLRLAFHGHGTLVLIGDPKQAIYAFRGADVHAYLAAAAEAGRVATLAHNWRSDPELLRGLAAVFRGAALGDERIVVGDIRPGLAGRSLDVAGAPVRVRVVRERSDLPVAEGRELVLDDLLAEVVELLDSGAVLTPRDEPPRPVAPRDLAVVVRTETQLDLVHRGLLAAGVPAVRRTTSSVFRTDAAHDWIVLLEALEQPHRSARVRRLAITRFVGWDAAALDAGDTDALALRVRRWLAVFAERGVAALYDAVARDQGLVPRLLTQEGGERVLTDLRHVADALHAAVLDGQLGLSAGAEWLRQRVAEAHADRADERSRRLDSDAAAVQVMTIHASKGLEFPVVYVPFAWDRHQFEPQFPLFHDAGGARLRNVGGHGDPGFAADSAQHISEELAEDLRLLYVALTRARSQVTAWWAPSAKNTVAAPLHRLLLTPEPAQGVPERVPLRPGVLDALAACAVEGALSVTVVEPRPRPRWRAPAPGHGALSVAVLARTLDAAWRRTSYTALTRLAYDAAHAAGADGAGADGLGAGPDVAGADPAVGSEPEIGEKDDEPLLPVLEERGEPAARVPSPMADLPGGTAFGTLVHAVLERWDPASGTGDGLAGAVAEQVRRFAPDLDAASLAAALEPALTTPLGPLALGRSLAGIAAGDRLVELDFELPLGGGDAATGSTRLADVAAVWREHAAPDDPLADYPDLLTDPLLGPEVLRGYLGGSIDAVLRVDGRFLVVDYKTNRLGVPDAPLTLDDYRPEALHAAMVHAHYPLQAMLYTVALHRFLRWRVAGYDPGTHLGGALYLFLRGMGGPAHGGSGVFAWRPAPGLVTAVSDALA